MISINLLFWGVLSDVSQTKSTTITLANNSSLATLKQQVIAQYPKLTKYHFHCAVNHDMVQEDVLLKDGDEVALMPPYAGG